MRRPDGVITLHSLQLSKTAHSQPLLVAFPLIDHSVNMLGENLSRLQKDGLITLL
jgi:hypothetical protein